MAIYVGLGSNVGNSSVADRFVAAANRGDYETVCHLYSPTYLKVSQTECRRLYRWGERLYGRYEYRITARRRLPNGHWRVSLTHWLDRSPSFIEIAGGKIVAGGW